MPKSPEILSSVTLPHASQIIKSWTAVAHLPRNKIRQCLTVSFLFETHLYTWMKCHRSRLKVILFLANGRLRTLLVHWDYYLAQHLPVFQSISSNNKWPVASSLLTSVQRKNQVCNLSRIQSVKRSVFRTLSFWPKLHPAFKAVACFKEDY